MEYSHLSFQPSTRGKKYFNISAWKNLYRNILNVFRRSFLFLNISFYNRNTVSNAFRQLVFGRSSQVQFYPFCHIGCIIQRLLRIIYKLCFTPVVSSNTVMKYLCRRYNIDLRLTTYYLIHFSGLYDPLNSSKDKYKQTF